MRLIPALKDSSYPRLACRKFHYRDGDLLINGFGGGRPAVYCPVEFMHIRRSPGIPQDCLILNVGTTVILLRNLSPTKLVNGTGLQIRALEKYIIEAIIFSSCEEAETVFIHRILSLR